MKNILLLFGLFFAHYAFSQNKPDKYEQYLQQVQKELQQMGMQVNVNNPNPFITGSALQGYFLNEKILLLERDAYFMMKSNKLETTEQVADFQHRLKVLTSHANNILLHMVRALQNAGNEGFGRVEAPKHQVLWEELLEQCKRNPDCISRRLASGEVVVQNDMIDSFSFSLQLFKQIPYMHALEFASIYQLVQLLHMEVMVGYSRVSQVEFDLFLKKQKKLIKEIDENKQMTKKEKEYHRTMVSNTLNKWKRKILERKFDQQERFQNLTHKKIAENVGLIQQQDEVRAKNPEILSESEICGCYLPFKKDRKKCELRAKLENYIDGIRSGKEVFIKKAEKKLPDDFWKSI
jgi:hypothetical protein